MLKIITLFFLLFSTPSWAQCSYGILLSTEEGTKSQSLNLEIADTPEKRFTGLMNRHTPLLDNQGMIFLFEEKGKYPFWMRNTYIPLDIAYISGTGEILEVFERDPLEEHTTPTRAQVDTVLEVRKGLIQSIKATHFLYTKENNCQF